MEDRTKEAPESPPPGEGRRRWSEQIEVAADQLVARVQELVAEGNVRPLTYAAVGGAAGVFLAPLLTALVAIAGVVARVQIIIEREGEPPAVGGPGQGI
jgi:hypothetical protein